MEAFNWYGIFFSSSSELSSCDVTEASKADDTDSGARLGEQSTNISDVTRNLKRKQSASLTIHS